MFLSWLFDSVLGPGSLFDSVLGGSLIVFLSLVDSVLGPGSLIVFLTLAL